MNPSPAQLTILRTQEQYHFHLHVPDPSPEARPHIGSGAVELLATTQFEAKIRTQLTQAIESAAEQLTAWHSASGSQRSALIPRLRSLGGLLYNLLLPPVLQSALHSLPNELPLMLVTDDTELPWELLHDDREHLLLQRPLSRRLLSSTLPRVNHVTELRERNVLVIANPTGDLPESESESERLIDLFDTAGQQITAKILARKHASLPQVREMLGRGDIDLIHYSGHARPGALLLHDGELMADEIQRVLRGAPIVFLNGCASASDTPASAAPNPQTSGANPSALALPFASSAIQSLAKAFLMGGATAFVGTLWPVLDEGSRHLAEWFYEWLLQGASVGDALYQVRRRAFELHAGDPAWTSYIHYGDPSQQLARRERREIRTATILMAKLTGLRALYASLGLERAAQVEILLLDHLSEIATRYGGEMRGPLTDIIGIRFGLPQANEDDAQRAVHTALDMVQELQSFVFPHFLQDQAAHQPSPIALHLGISSGRVLGRETWEAQGPVYQMTGEIIDIAAGLANQAQPGELLIDAATYQLVHRAFLCERMDAPGSTSSITPSITPSNVASAAPHVLYRVMAAVEQPLGRAGQIVGRDREVAQLLAWWEEARTGRGRIVEIVGRAGVGKSHLVQSLHTVLAQLPARPSASYRWIQLRSHSYDETSAYALLGQLIRELAQIDRSDDEVTQRQKLSHLVQSVVTSTGTRGDEQVAEGLSLLGQPLSLHFSAPHIEQLEANFRQRRLAGLLQALLARQTRLSPIILVLEDLHWSDEASLAVWQEIVRGVDRLPLLLLPVFRSEWSPPWMASISAQRLTLTELDTQAQHELVADLLGVASPPAALNQQLAAWSGGNPFFLKEAVIYLQESGRLSRNGEEWQFGAEGDETAPPPSIETLVQARLNRLKPAWRDMLGKAAVIGQEFARVVLEKIEPDINRREIDSTLDELVHRDLITEVSGWGAETVYAFRHGIIHQTVYTGLWDYHRRPVHRMVARALAALYGEGDHQVEVLAHHYYHSDDWVSAAHFGLRAGERAAAAYANRAAIEWYERALENLERRTMMAPESNRFKLDEEEINRRRLLALEGAADAYTTLGQIESAIQRYRQVLSLEEELFQPGLPRLAGLHYKIGRAQESKGKYKEAAQAFQQGLELLHGAPGLEAGRLHVWQGFLAFRQGYPDLALPLYDQGIRLIEQTDSPQDLAQALNLRGLIHRRNGQHEAALSTYARSETVSEAAAYLPGLVRVFNNRGIIYQDQGRWDEALAAYQRGAELAARTGEAWWQAGALVNQGEIYRRRGELDEALAVNMQALAIGEPIGLGEIIGLAHMNIGAVYLKQGQLDVAQQQLDHAQSLFEEQDAQGHLCELFTYLAELSVLQGRDEDALAQAKAALALAEHLKQPLALGQTLRVMAQVHQAEGRYGEARAAYLTSLGHLQHHPHELGTTFLRLAACCFQQSLDETTGKNERHSRDALLAEAREFCRNAIAQLELVGAQLELAEATALAVQIEVQHGPRGLE